jgi:hypothetical protein
MFNIFNYIADKVVVVPPFELLRYPPIAPGQPERYALYRASFLFGKFKLSEMLWNFGNGQYDIEEGWVSIEAIGNIDFSRYRVAVEIQEAEATIQLMKQASKPFERGELIRKLDI